MTGDPTSRSPESAAFAGQRVAFAGKLGALTKRQAMALVREHGGVPLDRIDETATCVVIGADQMPLAHPDVLDASLRGAVEAGRLTILSETEFWERLGMLEDDAAVRRLYTPAMLAELLRIPLATIRRWHRSGLIVPTREVHRLPYFDYQEVATARQLANLLSTGMTAAALEQKLTSLARFVRGVDRSLKQLAVIVEGRQVFVRQDDGLIEPTGQRRFDFDAVTDEPLGPAASNPSDLSAASPDSTPASRMATPEELLRIAAECEDGGQLPQAVEYYRAALAAGGPRAEVCFQLAELLYRLGDVGGARERYYMAIELNEDFVEARASLGCVLAEAGELELAIAALQGALVHHPHYADAHYHLARTLGELGRQAEARDHWQTFLELAPDSPWADEARSWLGVSTYEYAET